MTRPSVLIVRAPGTNCDVETSHAFEQAGAVPERVHIQRVLESPNMLDRFQILCFPGGFSYGDDIAAGRVLGNQVRHHLRDTLNRFRDSGKLLLGICNGFQILLRTGMLVADDEMGSPVTLMENVSRRYIDRWVQLQVEPNTRCVFLQDISTLYLPIAHAEGNFQVREPRQLSRLAENGQLPLTYTADTNFNGAVANVAGVCDTTGRVFGLMPHPERHLDSFQHPSWTRRSVSSATLRTERGDGFRIFHNAVQYF